MTLRVTTLNTTIKNATLSIIFTLSGVLLNVAMKPIMRNVVMLSVEANLEGISQKYNHLIGRD
jgi:hypothetical protein